MQTHGKTREKNPPHPKHTTKAAAARRPSPTRDGMRGNTSHASAHTVPLPHRSRVCENRPRTVLAISKNDECYTHTDRHRQTNSIMAPCTHPGMKKLFFLKAKNGLIMKKLFSLKAKNGLITSREVNDSRWPHTCSRPCAFEEKKNRR